MARAKGEGRKLVGVPLGCLEEVRAVILRHRGKGVLISDERPWTSETEAVYRAAVAACVEKPSESVLRSIAMDALASTSGPAGVLPKMAVSRSVLEPLAPITGFPPDESGDVEEPEVELGPGETVAGEAVGTAGVPGGGAAKASKRLSPAPARQDTGGFESPPASSSAAVSQDGHTPGLAPPVQSNGATTLPEYELCRDCQRFLEFPERRGPEHKRACGLWRET